MSGKSTYDQAISQAYGSSDDDNAIRIRELEALVQARLSHTLSQDTFDGLTKVQAHLQRQQEDLAVQLAAKRIDREDYLSRLNTALRNAMAENLRLLGRHDFYALFGRTGGEPEGLIDQKAFLSQPRSASVP